MFGWCMANQHELCRRVVVSLMGPNTGFTRQCSCTKHGCPCAVMNHHCPVISELPLEEGVQAE